MFRTDERHFPRLGQGIKPLTKLGVVDNMDVASTVMAILGNNLSSAEGKVLTEIFDSKQQ